MSQSGMLMHVVRFPSLISLLLASVPLVAGPAPPPERLPPPAIIQRFLDREDTRVVSFRAIRHLEAHNDRYKKHGWMDVVTTLDPERGFSFEVAAEGGSSYVRDKVLRQTLLQIGRAHV